MKYLHKLSGSYSSTVELYEDENGKKWVLKTVDQRDLEAVPNETYFLETLAKKGLNQIQTLPDSSLLPNQMYLEYVENSITVGDSQSPEAYRLFGNEVSKMHAIKYDAPSILDKDSKIIEIDWQDFITSQIDSGLSRINSKGVPFTASELEKIQTKLANLAQQPIHGKACLLHCDLHSNNALFTNNSTPKVYLFDKGTVLLAGHAYFDLAHILIEFPHLFALPMVTNIDQELFDRFISGYGYNFWQSDRELCRLYTLLRAINRVGTPFTPYLPDLIRQIIY